MPDSNISIPVFLKSLPAIALLDDEILSALRDLESADEEEPFFNSVIETFVLETPLLIAMLASALRANDMSSIQHHAHQLKGLCANLGIHRLCSLCDIIEGNASVTGALSLSRLGDLLEKTYAESIIELESRWKVEL
ncbi:MAG: Hpt domain-containing protein [Proteobacteria bacterium]|nr:MAG: Hpt domain-containing protein [Pseudomonadota bacterium]